MAEKTPKRLKKDDLVVVTATAKSKHMVAGKDYEVHAEVAEKYKASGVAEIDKKKTDALKSELAKKK